MRIPELATKLPAACSVLSSQPQSAVFTATERAADKQEAAICWCRSSSGRSAASSTSSRAADFIAKLSSRR